MLDKGRQESARHVRCDEGVTFGGRYDHSPVICGDGTTAPPDAANTYVPCATPGGRPPHAWLPDGRSLFDTFNFEWTLLVLGTEPPAIHAFELAAKAQGIDLKVVRHTSNDLLALYEAPLTLIRPDQIVAWRGHADTHAQAILAQLLGA